MLCSRDFSMAYFHLTLLDSFCTQASSVTDASSMSVTPSSVSANAFPSAATSMNEAHLQEQIKRLEVGLEKSYILYLEKQRMLSDHQPLLWCNTNVGSRALLRESVRTVAT